LTLYYPKAGNYFFIFFYFALSLSLSIGKAKFAQKVAGLKGIFHIRDKWRHSFFVYFLIDLYYTPRVLRDIAKRQLPIHPLSVN
jgi:hypothetical protein